MKLESIDVDDEEKQLGPFHVLQELVAETHVSVGALYKAGEIGNLGGKRFRRLLLLVLTPSQRIGDAIGTPGPAVKKTTTAKNRQNFDNNYVRRNPSIGYNSTKIRTQ